MAILNFCSNLKDIVTEVSCLVYINLYQRQIIYLTDEVQIYPCIYIIDFHPLELSPISVVVFFHWRGSEIEGINFPIGG